MAVILLAGRCCVAHPGVRQTGLYSLGNATAPQRGQTGFWAPCLPAETGSSWMSRAMPGFFALVFVSCEHLGICFPDEQDMFSSWTKTVFHKSRHRRQPLIDSDGLCWELAAIPGRWKSQVWKGAKIQLSRVSHSLAGSRIRDVSSHCLYLLFHPATAVAPWGPPCLLLWLCSPKPWPWPSYFASLSLFPHLSNEAINPWLEILLKINKATGTKYNKFLPHSWYRINASSFMHSAVGALITYCFPGTVMHTGDGFSKH